MKRFNLLLDTSRGVLFLLAITAVLTSNSVAFQTSLNTRPGTTRKLVVLEDYRRRSERFYPNERDYEIIDTSAFEDERYRYGDDRRERRRDDLGVAGRDYYDDRFLYDESNDSTRHLWIVVWATCWWYFYNGFSIVAHPPPTDKYFFKMDKETMQLIGAGLAFLPVPIYGAMSRLSKAFTLKDAQFSVLYMAIAAVPACVVISVFNPSHSRGWTALGFFETTMFLGVFVAHNVRQAAIREGPQPTEQAYRFERAEIPTEALADYRPPLYYQSTQVAAKLARDLVSFHVAMSVISYTLLQNKQTFSDLVPFNAELWAWVLVIVHMGHNCMVTAMFPGAQLSRFRTYVVADSALYGLHIYAALSSPIVQNWLSNPDGQTSKPHAVLGDQILVLWFVADAAMQLIGPLGRILQSIDFDEKFGLVVTGRGRRTDYYDDDDNRRYLPPTRR